MRRMLRRPWKGRLLCGVFMGLAARFAVPVALVRLAFVGLCLAHGFGIFAYVMAALLIPEEIRCWSAEEGFNEDFC